LRRVKNFGHGIAVLFRRETTAAAAAAGGGKKIKGRNRGLKTNVRESRREKGIIRISYIKIKLLAPLLSRQQPRRVGRLRRGRFQAGEAERPRMTSWPAQKVETSPLFGLAS